MIDLDKMYERYIKQWFRENAHKYETEEDIENVLSNVYSEWIELPLPELDGKSVAQYLCSKNPDELIEMLLNFAKEKSEPALPVLEKISKTPECAGGLINVIERNYTFKQKYYAVTLINQMNVKPPLEIYLDWLNNSELDFDFCETIVEILIDYADEAARIIYEKLDGADFETKITYAEILCAAKKDDKTFNLLTELFNTRRDIPLTANYLGKYGDERAAEILYGALDNCNYYEYAEVKNAIERLGGIVEDERDFSSDPYYKQIKNIE